MTKIEYFIGMMFLQKLARKLGLYKLMKHTGNITFVVNVYVEVNSEVIQTSRQIFLLK